MDVKKIAAVLRNFKTVFYRFLFHSGFGQEEKVKVSG